MNKTKFFHIIRETLFKGKLSKNQVQGIELILDTISDLNVHFQGYILATVYHETATQMQPLSEYGKGKSYVYGKWRVNSQGVKYCFKNGSRNSVYTFDECPHLFYGRGLVQLTWYDNYLFAEKRLKELGLINPDMFFLDDPELVNDPLNAILIMKHGMLEGWFTKRKLSHYFSGSIVDYVNARKIINGKDCADKIASYAKIFVQALQAR